MSESWPTQRAHPEGLALLDKALRHALLGPYQVQAAVAALHARARRFEDTDWLEIEQLYAALERLPPGALLVELGRLEEAREAFDRALALAKCPAEAAHIRLQIDRFMQKNDAARRSRLSSAAQRANPLELKALSARPARLRAC